MSPTNRWSLFTTNQARSQVIVDFGKTEPASEIDGGDDLPPERTPDLPQNPAHWGPA